MAHFTMGPQEKLTMLLMKLSLIITCLIFFQSLVSSPSSRQIDSSASLTAAGGLVIARTSTRCCLFIELTTGPRRGRGGGATRGWMDGWMEDKEGQIGRYMAERKRRREGEEREQQSFSQTLWTPLTST
uniref:Uncharacterized protein n=1 Tax=Gadus morhua TaxID=8049 RepID=A0A8C5AQH5_GADMO